MALAAALAIGGGLPGVAAAVPQVLNGAVVPSSDWSASSSAAVTWEQVDFAPPLPGPAAIQVRPVGEPMAPWATRAELIGPLMTGANGVIGLGVADLEGQFEVRVVIPGVAPATVGTLRLDRTGPRVSVRDLGPGAASLQPVVAHTDDAAGVGPSGETRLEINTAADGSGSGEWRALGPAVPGTVAEQRITAPTDGLADGHHRVRAIARDRLGNASTTDLGTAVIDRAPADLTGSTISLDPEDPRHLVVRVGLVVRDAGAAPLGDYTVAPVGAPDDVDLRTSAGVSRDAGLVRLPGPGEHRLEIRLPDAAGNVGRITIPLYVPSADEFPQWVLRNPGGVPVVAPPLPSQAGRPAGRGVLRAWSAAVRFHRARAGLRLAGRPRTIRTEPVWAALLGEDEGRVYAGVTLGGGQVVLGPRTTTGLALLDRAATGRLRRVARADVDRMVTALAVVLHESLHATGPPFRTRPLFSDPATTLEEALTETATVDLLGRYLAHLRVPAPLRAKLRVGVRRYRPAYLPQVKWARQLSVLATGQPAEAAVARAWRVAAADRFGDDRVRLIAQAARIDEAELVAGMPLIGPPRPAAR